MNKKQVEKAQFDKFTLLRRIKMVEKVLEL